MAESPLRAALEAAARPLEFALGDDSAAFERVTELEATVVQALRAVLGLRIPPDLRERVERAVATLDALVVARSVPPAGAAGAAGAADAARSAAASARAATAAEPASDEERRRLLATLAEWLRGLCAPGFSDAMLARKVDVLAGVGPKRAAQLEARGLGRIGDLLFHLPVRYDDRRSLEAIGDLEVGLHATFVGEVKSSELKSSHARGRARRVLEAVVGDETGEVILKWFRASDRLAESLSAGVRVLVTGDVRRYRFHKEIIHPDLEILGREGASDAPTARAEAGEDRDDREGDASAPALPAPDSPGLDSLRRVVPQYATPEGVPPRTLRKLIERAVAEYSDAIGGHLPAAFVRGEALPEPAEALRRAHEPEREAEVEAYRRFASSAHRRLVLEELYLLELGLGLRKGAHAGLPGIALADVLAAEGVAIEGGAAEAAVRSLPFELTRAQEHAWSEIVGDLRAPQPMNRLLQGDVGSGKTAVAFLAAVTAVASGHQVAFMAPTELLAEQHERTLRVLAAALPAALRPRIALLSSSIAKPEADAVRAGLAAGEIDLAIGTHALVQSEVEIPRLALAIVDEQHRFGVKQRAALSARGQDARVPHVLVMTATPIPRTLALTLYGDLDVSVIDELPPGRQPTRTLLVREGEGKRVAELVRAALDRDEQVYVVYPLVEESEKVDLRSAVESAQRIARAYADVRVDLVHGRLTAEERAAAMERFTAGETRILVSTTVIEVGVDVANATLMVVEHAERFGLAQLHQLRGRVGRGARPGTCVLVARGGGADSEARLRAMLETTDGFEIADADLRIRGPGEFLGTKQSGHLPDLRIADLVRDTRLLVRARELALAEVKCDPGLAGQPELRRAVELRWGERLALIDIGEATLGLRPAPAHPVPDPGPPAGSRRAGTSGGTAEVCL